MEELIVQEHLTVLRRLESLRSCFASQESDESYDTFLLVLQCVEFGWLTPGKMVLRLLSAGKISTSKILKQPHQLQRKWFSELDEIEKGRWLLKFANKGRNPKIRTLGAILDLTPRRLQQLQSLAKFASS